MSVAPPPCVRRNSTAFRATNHEKFVGPTAEARRRAAFEDAKIEGFKRPRTASSGAGGFRQARRSDGDRGEELNAVDHVWCAGARAMTAAQPTRSSVLLRAGRVQLDVSSRRKLSADVDHSASPWETSSTPDPAGLSLARLSDTTSS